MVRAQTETKQKHEQLKEASTALDRMMDSTTRYPQAPEHVPKKDWIRTQDAKVQIRMKMQSKDKLSKYLDKVMSAYEHLISSIDSMHTLHHIPSLGALDEEKTWDPLDQEILSFLQPIRQAAVTPDLAASRENLGQFLVTQV